MIIKGGLMKKKPITNLVIIIYLNYYDDNKGPTHEEKTYNNFETWACHSSCTFWKIPSNTFK